VCPSAVHVSSVKLLNRIEWNLSLDIHTKCGKENFILVDVIITLNMKLQLDIINFLKGSSSHRNWYMIWNTDIVICTFYLMCTFNKMYMSKMVHSYLLLNYSKYKKLTCCSTLFIFVTNLCHRLHESQSVFIGIIIIETTEKCTLIKNTFEKILYFIPTSYLPGLRGFFAWAWSWPCTSN
jgi:hypothetical protein